ncbi:MAG: single-stranded-DNA-specific exonuclease RecJ [Oscillospiraceae bacterium]|nr:single-stranded-DNA-specific exonuclease RecJ [Oscillospiraceae bacterium]
MPRRKWCVSNLDKEKASELSAACSIDPFASLLLVSRGITSKEEVEKFFSSGADFCDPFSIRDMDKAVERINRAVEQNEKIAVYGDYDADGVTASSLLYLYLEMLGADVVCYIPDREAEGYGLNISAVETFAADSVKLIVTVDNGISAIAEARRIYELGMELVVTDHHKVGSVLPKAEAVVDPHREDDTADFEDWAGVGVAFKLICALSDGESEEILENFADLIAVGTIADIVPLTGENRAIVRRGIEKINSGENIGIKALREVSGTAEKALGASGVAFGIVPRINAIGRLERADKAFELLISQNEERAKEIAREIDLANAKRQELEQQITLEAQKQLEQNPERAFDRVLVFDGEGWHGGVIGIVAARFVDRYLKPCVVITSSGVSAKGSGRSIEGFSLYDAINSVSDLLTHFGGHTLAAGFGIEAKDIPEFRRRINEYAKTVQMPFAALHLDCRLKPQFISAELIPVIESLEPFGAGNPQPLFGLFDMTINSVQPLKGGKHVRLNLTKDRANITALKFSTPFDSFPYRRGDRVDLAVRLEKNEYMGQTKVSIYIKDIRMAGTDDEKYLRSVRLYEKIRRKESVRPEHAALAKVDRAFVASVYRFLKKEGGFSGDSDILCYRLGGDGSNACRVLLSVDILCELGILKKADGKITLCGADKKVNLADSDLMAYLESIAK